MLLSTKVYLGVVFWYNLPIPRNRHVYRRREMNSETPETENPDDELTDREDEFVSDIVRAMKGLPIISQLEFTKNLLFDHGGDRGSAPLNPITLAATEIIDGVIEVLRKHPRAARLRRPDL